MSFLASNVTRTHSIPVEVDRTLPAGTVTESIADRMALPDEVAWVLRDDGSSVYLDEGRPIGEQIAPGSSVTITPRAHLGAALSGRKD